jgi:predicted component of type VI protein secretion system
MAKLVFIGEKFGGRVYEFAVERTTVGRGAENTLSIQDTSVSHTHCEIFVYNEDVIVRDLGSSNGTFVNGERLHKQQRSLKAGHIVKFGTVEARLELAAISDSVTDLTAIHSFDRNREVPRNPANPAPPVTLAGISLPAASEHTMMLSRTPESQPPPSLPREEPRGKIPVWMIVFLILDVIIVVWALLR